MIYQIDNISKFHAYQNKTYSFGLNTPRCGLFLDMGLGKTVITLSIIKTLMAGYYEVEKALIIAPKRVCESTWDDERDKWEHTQDLRVSKVIGTEKQRLLALQQDADIYLTNPENVAWLVAQYGYLKLPFQMLVIDESSKFKSHKSVRFKSLAGVMANFSRVILLTGTPSPNGLIDLWSQMFLIDKGERLGHNITAFRKRYFERNFSGFGYQLREGCDELIKNAVSDVCISLSAEDLGLMPEIIISDSKVSLGAEVLAMYNEFEKEQLIELYNQVQGRTELITASHAGVLVNKLLQFANGAVYYDDKRNYIEIHDKKLEALVETFEDCGNKPMLVGYQFEHDVYRIKREMSKQGINVRLLLSKQDVTDWNNKKIDMLLAHPASAGYGLNLQYGGYLVTWFGATYNLEHYQQFNTRVARQGQKQPVILNHLLASKTQDHRVISRLVEKSHTQKHFLQGLDVQRLIEQENINDIVSKMQQYKIS